MMAQARAACNDLDDAEATDHEVLHNKTYTTTGRVVDRTRAAIEAWVLSPVFSARPVVDATVHDVFG